MLACLSSATPQIALVMLYIYIYSACCGTESLSNKQAKSGDVCQYMAWLWIHTTHGNSTNFYIATYAKSITVYMQYINIQHTQNTLSKNYIWVTYPTYLLNFTLERKSVIL